MTNTHTQNVKDFAELFFYEIVIDDGHASIELNFSKKKKGIELNKKIRKFM